MSLIKKVTIEEFMSGKGRWEESSINYGRLVGIAEIEVSGKTVTVRAQYSVDYKIGKLCMDMHLPYAYTVPRELDSRYISTVSEWNKWMDEIIEYL